MHLRDVVVLSESESLRTLMSFALGRYWGVVVRQAADDSEAAARIDERPPQLLVIDADARGACAIAAVAVARRVHVIAVNDDLALCEGTGAHLVDSPFHPAKLHDVIDRVFTA